MRVGPWFTTNLKRQIAFLALYQITVPGWDGVSFLLHDGQLLSDSRSKAEILSQQFRSVFTDQDTTNMPKLEGPPTTDMDKIEITESGITKLLSEMNANKHSDLMSFQIYSSRMMPRQYLLFWKIFSKTIQTGKLLDEWVEANISPVFLKKDMLLLTTGRSPWHVFVLKCASTFFSRAKWPT